MSSAFSRSNGANPKPISAATDTGHWLIRVFGEVSARWVPGDGVDGDATAGEGAETQSRDIRFRTDKARLLFAFLAAQAGSEQRRDALAERLWPGSPDPLQNLASELHYLKRAFGSEGEDLLKGSRRYVWLDPARTRIDLHEFEADVLAAGAPDTPEEERFARLSRAVDAYRGPLLAHLYGVSALDNWIVEVQTRAAALYADALAALVRGYSLRGDRRQARVFALRIPDISLLGEEDRAFILEAVAGPEGAPDVPLLNDDWSPARRAGRPAGAGGAPAPAPRDPNAEPTPEADLMKVLRHEEALRMAGAMPTEDETRLIARVVRAAMDALPDAEQDALARLSCLGGTFDAEAGKLLYRALSPEADAFPGRFEALVRGHFVRDLKSGRYAVVDVVRREAAPRLAAGDRTRLQRRIVAYFYALVRGIDRQYTQHEEERRKAYFHRVVPHTESLERTLDALLPHEGAGTLGEPLEVSLAFRAARLVTHLGGFYRTRNRFDRWAHFGARLLPLLHWVPPFWRDSLYGTVSYIAFETGQARHEEEAQSLFARLEALRPSASESVWLSTYLLRFGGGAPGAADDMAELERRYLATREDATEGQWEDVIHVATIAHHAENDERAIRLYEFALPHLTGPLRARALHHYADALAVQGRLPDALSAAEEALERLTAELGPNATDGAPRGAPQQAGAAHRDARKRLITLLALSADLLHADARCGLALERFRAALDELTLFPDLALEESALRDLGFLHITRGEFAAARIAFRASLQICEEKRLADAAAVARGGLGIAALRSGDEAGGQPFLDEALAHWTLRRHHRWQARFLLPLAEADYMRGDPEAARARLALVDEHVARTVAPGSQSAAWDLRARLLLRPYADAGADGAALPGDDLLRRALLLHREALALRRRCCGQRDLIYSIEGIAGALALTGHPAHVRQAGVLWGCCTAAREHGSMPILPPERREQAPLHGRAEAALGADAFGDAVRDGGTRDLATVAQEITDALNAMGRG